MIGWNGTKKRWKKTADAAIAVGCFAGERDRLAAEVAKRIWVANGGREWADARGEGSLVGLEPLVMRHLHDGVVQAALALRYVSVLEASLLTADYEDAQRVQTEARWAEEYLAGAAQCALLPHDGQGSRTALAQPAGERLDQLRAALAALVMAELKAASVAAA